MLKFLSLSTLVPERACKWLSGKAGGDILSKPVNEKKEEQDFSFVWYCNLQTRTTDSSTHNCYTSPFRTVIKAETIDEAKIKLQDFTLGKCNLKICEEDDYVKSGLYSIGDEMVKLNK